MLLNLLVGVLCYMISMQMMRASSTWSISVERVRTEVHVLPHFGHLGWRSPRVSEPPAPRSVTIHMSSTNPRTI